MSNNARDLLLKERDKLKIEKEAAIAQFDAQIQDLDTAIERISGKKVWEVDTGVRYDDEHPDYIKASAEEL